MTSVDLEDKPQTWQEKLRGRYRPDRVRVLFVGESPPKNRTFFYCGNSLLHNAFREAFDSPDDFLAEFQSRGFFLDDLVPFPVNRMSREDREAARQAHIDRLSYRLRAYQPEAVVTVMKAIEQEVAASMRRAGLSVPHHVLPFPWPKHEERFVKGLRTLLESWPS